MIEKPERFSSKNAEAFQDLGVVESYRYRPSYPAEVFDILVGLIGTERRIILDAGCGTGNIARGLVQQVERVDAVDFSQHMIEYGKRLPQGNHPHLNWIHGRVEDVALAPPYALITAGESLHWMDWNVVLPRFRQVLTARGYLAIVEHHTTPDPWSILGEIIPRYRTDGGYQPFDMIEALEQHGLFQQVGKQVTTPVAFAQSIDDFIESYHSRSGFSRERMGAAQANAFDLEAKSTLMRAYRDGIIPLQVIGSVVWGVPKERDG